MSRPYKGKDFQDTTTTRVVYVGVEGVQELNKRAVEISHKGGKLITAAQLARYLVFNMHEETVERLIKEMKSELDEKGPNQSTAT